MTKKLLSSSDLQLLDSSPEFHPLEGCRHVIPTVKGQITPLSFIGFVDPPNQQKTPPKNNSSSKNNTNPVIPLDHENKISGEVIMTFNIPIHDLDPGNNHVVSQTVGPFDHLDLNLDKATSNQHVSKDAQEQMTTEKQSGQESLDDTNAKTMAASGDKTVSGPNDVNTWRKIESAGRTSFYVFTPPKKVVKEEKRLKYRKRSLTKKTSRPPVVAPGCSLLKKNHQNLGLKTIQKLLKKRKTTSTTLEPREHFLWTESKTCAVEPSGPVDINRVAQGLFCSHPEEEKSRDKDDLETVQSAQGEKREFLWESLNILGRRK